MTVDIGETPTPAPPEVPAAQAGKGAFERLAGVLFAPAETFQDIARRPDIIVPLLVILVVSIISAVLIVPRVDFEGTIREQMASQDRQMSAEDEARAVRIAVAAAKGFAYASPVISLIILAIVAGALLLLFRMLGGEGNFKQAFSVTLYGWMPLIIQSIVGMIILLARGKVPADQLNNLVMSNLSFLVDMKEQPVIYALLSSIDLFTFWTLALLTIGFAYVSRFTRAKAATIIISAWLVVLVVKLGFAAMGSRMQKA